MFVVEAIPASSDANRSLPDELTAQESLVSEVTQSKLNLSAQAAVQQSYAHTISVANFPSACCYVQGHAIERR